MTGASDTSELASAPDKPLPSFSEQLAVVYDDYMGTLGGGERSALAYALALKKLDFTVELVSRNELPSRERLTAVFGPELAGVTMRRIDTDDVHSFLKPAELTVFVNHTFMSFVPSPARIGIYSQMFPVAPVRHASHPVEVKALRSYRLMLCNSSFTQRYTAATWDYPRERCLVLHPPIGSEHIDAARIYRGKLPEKRRQFVNVGRFNPGTHNKNQKIVIESFLDARGRFQELRDWKLILIGNSNADAESRQYLRQCLELAERSGGAVEVRQDVDLEELKKTMAASFGYVHATGAFSPPGHDPFKCEHLGLSIVEAMANACVPLVYARGGIFDVLEPGTMGIPYITYDGLMEGYREIAALYDDPAAASVQHRCLEAACQLSHRQFTARLAELIVKEMLA